MTWPETKLAPSLTRREMGWARSGACPGRRTGMRAASAAGASSNASPAPGAVAAGVDVARRWGRGFRGAWVGAVWPTAAPTGIGRRPASVLSFTVRAHAASSRARTATASPSAASLRAVAAPMPRAEPVTIAILSVTRFSPLLTHYSERAVVLVPEHPSARGGFAVARGRVSVPAPRLAALL